MLEKCHSFLPWVFVQELVKKGGPMSSSVDSTRGKIVLVGLQLTTAWEETEKTPDAQEKTEQRPSGSRCDLDNAAPASEKWFSAPSARGSHWAALNNPSPRPHSGQMRQNFCRWDLTSFCELIEGFRA